MRRTMLVIAAGLCLAGCGGPDESQANDPQANISTTASPPATASASTVAVPQLPAQAPATKDEALKLMHERHEGMEDMGKAMKAIGRELKSSSPDLGEIQAATPKITSFAPRVPALFPPGTGKEVGKTGAKAEIWQTPRDFAAKAHEFALAAQSFGAAVNEGDVAKMKSSFATLGDSCKACHDKYRVEMKH